MQAMPTVILVHREKRGTYTKLTAQNRIKQNRHSCL